MTQTPTEPDPKNIAVLRLLINDPKPESGTAPEPLFTDGELAAFLTLEGGVVKLAAAQAIDTIADNEALVAKVIRDQDVASDGAKVADSLRKRAAALRAQAAAEEDALDDGYFEVVPVLDQSLGVEHTNDPFGWI